ncbi:hypothetical protein A2971_05175 [Candidatus Gottesmanbacteria bacterium RIFCSPLOWO2_01_FULL_46_21]|uniref:Uncharacterized protein n=1 Tax=Candidatus Gottesmanbacteria bacterium RIFCSPLOWO2_01_FULL_46_21 TaxID=1798393 RepID=A0A1F6AZ46_9BACT|nr:MAG: hypothetical protein A2971_05175 [Candidatus Gottesmanbacteria bacterium RIFCSPLOWO2_01_FULL_46_21]
MGGKLEKLIATGATIWTLLQTGGSASGEIKGVDAGSTDTKPSATQPFPDYDPGYEIEVDFTNGSTLYCRDHNRVGLLYPPEDSQSPTGPGNCDIFISREQLGSVLVNGQRMVIPETSKGVVPSDLTP